MKIENGELKKNESLKQKQKGHSTGDYIHEDCLEWYKKWTLLGILLSKLLHLDSFLIFGF